MFIFKISATGTFLWAKQIGGSSDDLGYSISFDKNGNVYTCGTFGGLADIGLGTNNLVSNGNNDAYIVKLDKNGNYIWAKSIGGLSNDQAISLAVDGNQNVFVTGLFKGTVDFDPSSLVKNMSSIGTQDIFILKLDGDGKFKWINKAILS